jgi:hypothetical protein
MWAWGRTTAGRIGTRPDRGRRAARPRAGRDLPLGGDDLRGRRGRGREHGRLRLSESGLPELEDDQRRTWDTGSGEQNP